MDMGNRPPPLPTWFGRFMRGLIRRMVKLIVIAGIFLVVVVVFVLVLGKAAQQAERNRPAPPPEPEQTPAIPRITLKDTSPEGKAKCDALLAKIQGLGVFGDLKLSGGVGSVVAGPAFDGLEFSAKQDFASTAFMWCLYRDPDCVVLTITDRFTGKEIGQFSAFSGFKMD
jgi:hypothetical protein